MFEEEKPRNEEPKKDEALPEPPEAPNVERFDEGVEKKSKSLNEENE